VILRSKDSNIIARVDGRGEIRESDVVEMWGSPKVINDFLGETSRWERFSVKVLSKEASSGISLMDEAAVKFNLLIHGSVNFKYDTATHDGK
jgi:hypothetical protein